MINTTLIKTTTNETKLDLEQLFNSIYLLPNWERIREFSLDKKTLFNRKSFKVQLYRKFSSKNMIEKYSIRYGEEKVVATMDLKVYKDNVYIINIDTESSTYLKQATEKLLQVAVEKSMFNTTEKEVKINLSFTLLKQSRMRHILAAMGFIPDEFQSKYEKEMFGETYTLKAANSEYWQKKIKQSQILINE